MKLFDVVIGNPPYNRGMDLDFVNLGFDISNKYVCMITPAKWQTSDSNQKVASKINYNTLRTKTVPFISHLKFYPDCLDIFGISQADGITYFLVDKYKDIKTNCLIENSCNLQSKMNSIQIRSITQCQTLWNIGNDTIKQIGDYEHFDINEYIPFNRKAYTVNINNQLADSRAASGAWDFENGCIRKEFIGRGGQLFNQNGQIFLLNKTRILKANEQSDVSASKDVFTSDKLSECESFLSWIISKFTRFFILINISSLTILNNNSMKLVPAPAVLDNTGKRVKGGFDHIYTDKELYHTFNISSESIEIIESIIRNKK